MQFNQSPNYFITSTHLPFKASIPGTDNSHIQIHNFLRNEAEVAVRSTSIFIPFLILVSLTISVLHCVKHRRRSLREATDADQLAVSATYAEERISLSPPVHKEETWQMIFLSSKRYLFIFFDPLKIFFADKNGISIDSLLVIFPTKVNNLKSPCFV